MAANRGYRAILPNTGYHQYPPSIAWIYICPGCERPTYIEPSGGQYPSPQPGRDVENLPEDLGKMYEEARLSAMVGAYSASVMVGRVMLMHIAVEKGAKAGLHFEDYVNYLDQKGYVPPDGKQWVDYIRQLGNQANHKIRIMPEQDARNSLHFVEMLLRFIYELPKRVPPPKSLPTS